MDALYIVRPGDDNPQLRYSLRSLKNLPHDRLWIVGHRPSWVTGVEHVPGNRGPTPHQCVFDNVRIACNIDELSDPFVMLNDDFYIMRPAKLETWWRQPLAEQIASIAAWSAWRQSLEATSSWLTRQGYADPLSYELHVPLLVHKDKMAAALDEVSGFSPLYPPQWRTVYHHRWQLEGSQHPDVKVKPGGSWDPSWPFLSTDAVSFEGPVGDHVRAQFPHRSPYEE